ncbi:ABC transporter ATP-binding protein [Peribacillus huizhouensis]|uniref:ABC-2 type transport system ATP-binding protein n=1 Tax=Peribacillus huizhouensis TaxID=1501239 RepID=A0ABR6CK83_9BACI|nr:ABC transporter ATP-binding protein [Peribacillus huizhouensis]MBA9025331.1 ABC-2 type transport system ATP-binding protein [Peribacillus huizhouensis]
MIYCENVTKKYNSFQALNGISFTIEGNGCFGFLGRNGAGKTTAIRILAGLLKPTSGIVKVNGLDVEQEKEKLAEIMGYLPQHPAFYEYMTGNEWMHWVGQLFRLEKKTVEERTENLLKDCGIWEARNRKISGYSGGMKQRLGLAQALMNRPKLLILDEPVSALDPVGRHEMLTMIMKLKEDMMIFMSSHILEDVEKIADHIIMIDKGEIVLSSCMQELKSTYTSPVIRFSLSEAKQELTKVLNEQEWVMDIQVNMADYILHVKDMTIASAQLPKLISYSGAMLVSYQVDTPSLEDIFLRKVR